MPEDRSTLRIVQSGRDVKSWQRHLPSPDEVRPGRCSVCGVASRPCGAALQLWGHGLRQRQQRGPLDPEGAPVVIVITVRRYLCLACGAVILVVPCGMLPARHFSAGAIAWALALFGVIMKATRGALRHRRLAMTLYLGTGWIGLTVIRPLALAVPLSALLWLIIGGIAYTAGTLFFANERLRYGHFVWHLFVLAGTGCHFAAVFICAI